MNKINHIYFSLLFILIMACACPAVPLLPPMPVSTSTSTSIVTQEMEAAEPPPFSYTLSPFTYAWEDREPFRNNLSTSAQSVLMELPGATIYHLALSFGNPPIHARGVEEVRYTNTETIPLDEINLAIFPDLLGGNMEILSITLEGTPIIPIYDEWFIRLPLEKSLEPGDQVTFHIEFEVDVPSVGGGIYYGIFGYNNNILSFAHAYPTILVYNHEGWNNQKPDLDGDPLFADASFYLVSIEAPVDFNLVTSGVELARIETNDQQSVLIANGPARDFYLAASTGWIKQTDTIADTSVNVYSPRELESSSWAALEFAIAALSRFNERYGYYNYTEFDIVPIVTSAGGVEYPGMTSISDEAYSWSDFLEIVIVHETAHMWFYNLVGNDTLDQPWLDESLAQFATWQYYMDRYGEEEAELFAQIDLQSTWDMAENPYTPIGLPVSAYRGHDYASIVYGRGPFFFMALRDRVGIETFDRFMRDYVYQYSWKISSTEEFKLLAEEKCMCDLTPLFAEWVYP